ncbi:hypothetical protein CRYUN_Cryun15aG0052000 [Craigia yunnanensis]
MGNGGLQEHLYPISGSNNVNLKLDWETRLRIALEAAKGLEYLHEHVSPPVIHRNFKSSNILLDKKFHAKVSDFGLAKLGSDKAGGHIRFNRHLTTKSDVYSYGAVLLELLTGRVPVDAKRPPGEDREKVVQIMDPALEGQYSIKEVIQVAAIAAMCVQPEADYRPSMADAVKSLVPLVKTHRSTAKVGSCSSFHSAKSPTSQDPSKADKMMHGKTASKVNNFNAMANILHKCTSVFRGGAGWDQRALVPSP